MIKVDKLYDSLQFYWISFWWVAFSKTYYEIKKNKAKITNDWKFIIIDWNTKIIYPILKNKMDFFLFLLEEVKNWTIWFLPKYYEKYFKKKWIKTTSVVWKNREFIVNNSNIYNLENKNFRKSVRKIEKLIENEELFVWSIVDYIEWCLECYKKWALSKKNVFNSNRDIFIIENLKDIKNYIEIHDLCIFNKNWEIKWFSIWEKINNDFWYYTIQKSDREINWINEYMMYSLWKKFSNCKFLNDWTAVEEWLIKNKLKLSNSIVNSIFIKK